MRHSLLNKSNWTFLLFAATAAILAFEPILWLIGTWRDPSYASSGFFLILPVLALFIWSVTSKRNLVSGENIKFPLLLLFFSALTRLAGQMFAINIIGALTLILDVYAITCLLNLDKRVRSISPFWLSVAFSFSLPLERMAQRLFGFGLQNISAEGACLVLGNVFDNVTCQGIRILINHQDVMVDLPCSGARAALLLLLFFCLVASVARFSLFETAVGLLITATSAYISNVIRICVLSAGIGYPDLVGGINVMSQPAHDMIGLLILSLGGMPIILWARHCYSDDPVPALPKKLAQDGWWLQDLKTGKTALPISILFLIGAIGITQISGKAVDVSRTDIPISLPSVINGSKAQNIPLTAQEQNYFTLYGGSAKKASYGNKNLLIVKTSSPLRHLHAPDTCLRGMGLDVDYIGADYNGLPTAIYKATDEQGTAYRVLVTFASADFKYTTTNISEAIWRWSQEPSVPWIAIQRISRWDDPTYGTFEHGVMASLSLPSSAPGGQNITLAAKKGDFK